MTRGDAERRAAGRNAEGAGGRWFAREGADGRKVADDRFFDGPRGL